MDPDEKVRTTAVKGIALLFATPVHVHLELARAVSQRCSDKKPSVRFEAIQAISKVYDTVYVAWY